MSDNTEILCLKGLCKTLGKRLIVDHVSLRVNASQVVGLFGPNGAGKTTTFYMIAGILPADSGQTLLDGVDISKYSLCERAAKRINYLAQEGSIFRYLSVYDNIYSILEYRVDLNERQRLDECEKLIESFDLGRIRESLGIRLSGGERRRTEIARLLAANPRVVLMDEPFSGIDPISIKETKILISRLRNQGISTLITDHNIRDSLEICDYVYIFNLGQIVAQGAPEEIINNPIVQKVYLGTSQGDDADSS